MPALSRGKAGFRLRALAKLARSLLPGRHAPAQLSGAKLRLPGLRRTRKRLAIEELSRSKSEPAVAVWGACAAAPALSLKFDIANPA